MIDQPSLDTDARDRTTNFWRDVLERLSAIDALLVSIRDRQIVQDAILERIDKNPRETKE